VVAAPEIAARFAAMQLVIHGGAGRIVRRQMTSRREAASRAALEGALAAGYRLLRMGASSLDAVTAAVAMLEDAPGFNAGRGAVLTSAGTAELDASVMEGSTQRAGAVACVRRIRNPVLAARAVMERSAHVLLAGAGAERFARRHGLAMVPPEYFVTRGQEQALRQRLHGTVGAVALDAAGHLAAATSTGGRSGKLPGRVGDSPVIGAGTYADDLCAVSGTGDGEAFMRTLLAYEVAARVRHLREPLERAAARALARVTRLGGAGGLIAIDQRGCVATPFTTEGMFRGWIARGGKPVIKMYG
jgi:isoaspartyl peptidase/L-asparaginase-like protein (Ntn-hydrolase superfamily)